MDGRTYAEEVLRTYTGSQDPKTQLTLSALGLTGESGEVAEAVKKTLCQGHELDQRHLAEELGDILWCIVLGCNAIGFYAGGHYASDTPRSVERNGLLGIGRTLTMFPKEPRERQAVACTL